jgi:hypothetical protein
MGLAMSAVASTLNRRRKTTSTRILNFPLITSLSNYPIELWYHQLVHRYFLQTTQDQSPPKWDWKRRNLLFDPSPSPAPACQAVSLRKVKTMASTVSSFPKVPLISGTTNSYTDTSFRPLKIKVLQSGTGNVEICFSMGLPSSSISIASPSVSSCLTAESEDDGLDGIVIPEGPLTRTPILPSDHSRSKSSKVGLET